MENTWISMKAKMPEVGQKVLIVYVTWSGKHITIAKLPGNPNFFDRPVMATDGGFVILLDRVTHWQPLPELPED